MRAVSQDGRTIFFVSHNMKAIRRLCRRVFLIRSGHLCEEDSWDCSNEYLEDAAEVPETV